MDSAKNIKVAGFGGQGVMLFGQILAYAATKEELYGLWFPSYGPETRGGTANCSVIVSNKQINSPVFKNANHLVCFNLPSLQKFKSKLVEDGLVLYNSSIIDESEVKDIKGKVYGIPINDIANELGNAKVANLVMMGAYLELTHLFEDETIYAVLKKKLGDKKAYLLDVNIKAIQEGRNYIKKSGVKYA